MWFDAFCRDLSVEKVAKTPDVILYRPQHFVKNSGRVFHGIL